MKDIIGQELVIGDTVAFTHSGTTQMFLAKVSGFTAQMVKVTSHKHYKDEFKKSNDRLLKITEQHEHFLENFPEAFL